MIKIIQHHIEQNKFKIFFIISIFLAIFSFVNVSASTYTPNTNLFEGTYSNNLIDMAINQVDNFYNKKFVVFQIDNNYYLVTGDESSSNGNIITFTNSTIFSAIRNVSGGYNSYYEYSKSNESSTTVNAYYVVISNINIPKSVTSSRFENLKTNVFIENTLIFILGLVFAIFLTRERSF